MFHSLHKFLQRLKAREREQVWGPVPLQRFGVSCNYNKHLSVGYNWRIKSREKTIGIFCVVSIRILALATPEFFCDILRVESDDHALHCTTAICVTIYPHDRPHDSCTGAEALLETVR